MKKAYKVSEPSLGKRHAFTMVEMVMAMGIGILVIAFGIYLATFTTRALRVLDSQMQGQICASREMYDMSEKIRNAKLNTIFLYASGSPVTSSADRIDFQSVMNSSGVVSSFRWVGTSLYYYPDVSNITVYKQYKYLTGVSFARVTTSDGTVFEVSVQFKYPKYRGFNLTENEKLNGTFVTHVFARNA